MQFWRRVLAGLSLFVMRPSVIFSLLKLPVMWRFYMNQTADPGVAGLFVVFWILLAFWIARWGSWYFWASILLQVVFAGFPDVRAAISSGATDLLDLRANWSVWLFAAGLSLEILEWTRQLRRTSPPVA